MIREAKTLEPHRLTVDKLRLVHNRRYLCEAEGEVLRTFWQLQIHIKLDTFYNLCGFPCLLVILKVLEVQNQNWRQLLQQGAS